MADIDLQKERKSSLWPWVVGALALVLVLWALMEAVGDDEPDVAAVEEVETTEPAAVPEASSELTLATILAEPQTHIGQSYAPGEVVVDEGATERAFWIQADDGRILALLSGSDSDMGLLEEGQRLRISEGVIQNADYLAVEANNLDDETREIAENEEVFLAVAESDVELIESGDDTEDGTRDPEEPSSY